MMTSTLADYELALAFVLACCAKATVLLVCAWTIAIALRQRSSAAQRHHVWAAAILCSLALPFLSLLLPAWHSDTLGTATTLWGSAHAKAASSSSYPIPSIFVDAATACSAFNKLVL